jgi:transposase
MARQFITVDYAATLKQTVTLEECLPTDHLARFIVGVVALLDLKAIYAGYAAVGGAAFAPELLLGLLFYGYATGVFSSRKLETATYEAIPVRFIAGGLHPDHDTLAHFRKTFLPQISELFVQVLLVAADLGVLKVGQINVSFDGSKIHADASKSHAVSYGRLRELETQLRGEVAELLALGAQADQATWPAGLDVAHEVALRQQRLGNLAEAKQILAARAQERYAAEQAEYEAKLLARQAKAAELGHQLGGRVPQPPTPGPRPEDQYNFTDPDSRIMKNSTDQGFNQAYNAQAVVDQATLLVVGQRVTNHPNDKNETLPDLDAVPAAVGRPQAAAGDTGFYSAANIVGLEERGIAPYLATGRAPHHPNWREYFAEQPAPPPADASPAVKMAYQLRSELGQAIYRLRKCTVEPVFGIIKETLGFRQFSLRGLVAVAGEWCLVCLAFNLKRLHVLLAN